MKVTYMGPHRSVSLFVDGRTRTVDRLQSIQVSSEAGEKLVKQKGVWVNSPKRKSTAPQAEHNGVNAEEVDQNGSA